MLLNAFVHASCAAQTNNGPDEYRELNDQRGRFRLPLPQERSPCVVPIFWGNVLHDEDFRNSGRLVRWPSHALGLRFQMSILQGQRGTCMVWSEDYEVMQPKVLRWNCFADNPGLTYTTENIHCPIEQQNRMTTVVWRLNTFGGDWREPADRYKAHLERAYDLKLIKASRPRLARELQVFGRQMRTGTIRALDDAGLDLCRYIAVQWWPGWFSSPEANLGRHWDANYQRLAGCDQRTRRAANRGQGA